MDKTGSDTGEGSALDNFSAGNAYFLAKDYARAAACYTEALRFDPNNATIYSNRSACHTRRGHYKSAVVDAQQCIRLQPEWPKGYYRLALAFQRHALEQSTDQDRSQKLQLQKNCFKSIAVAAALEPHTQLYRDMFRAVRGDLEQDLIAADFDHLLEEMAQVLPKGLDLLRKEEVGVEKYGNDEKVVIPVTVLSGFLGAGKTTLLQHLLENPGGKKIGVIVNDMSEVNIDAEIVKAAGKKPEHGMVELSNGCICCTLRDDLLTEIIDMCELKGKELDLDYIVVESTGISEPLPVAQTFLLEDIQGRSLQEYARLDCTVTCVDITGLMENVRSKDTLNARGWGVSEHDTRTVTDVYLDQLEFANVIVLNKVDLLQQDQRETCIKQARDILLTLNPSAKVVETVQSRVDPAEVLDTGLFSLEKASQAPGWLQELNSVHTSEIEELGISSWVFSSTVPLEAAALQRIVTVDLLKEYNILRSKGFVHFAEDLRLKLSWSSAGRHMGIKVAEISEIDSTLGRKNMVKLVFIGIGLKVDELKETLDAALVGETNKAPAVAASHALKPLLSSFYERLAKIPATTTDR